MPWMIPRLLKNLFAAPVTRRYPLEQRAPFADARGALQHDREKCDLCGDCVRLCPAQALSLDQAKKTLGYDPFRCIYCRVCVESCLHGAVIALTTYEPPAQAHEGRSWR